MSVQTTSTYIGKCKKCRTSLRVDYDAIQDLTPDQYKARDFDTTGAFMIYRVQPFGYCEEHGPFVIKFLKGRYSPERQCDARCMGATGPSCDCSCGGANHGANHG